MSPANNKMYQRIHSLIQHLNEHLYEKEEIVRLVILSALAGESIFLLGPPGTAKSMIARRLKFAFSEAKTFEYLMGKFSTPDEVFGPVSISKLKDEDKYERMIEHYLPGAQIVFLDEIWKASPPIQNALLTVLNEKVYRNGEQEIPVDIRALISASNELPLRGEGLEALWDRFLIRLVVGNIKAEIAFEKMLLLPGKMGHQDPVPTELKITHEEYAQWQKVISEITVPPHVIGLVNQLRSTINKRNATAEDMDIMYVSDRRWRKIVQLMRAAAFLNGRKEVQVIDAFLIHHCIWDRTEQIDESEALVLGAISQYGYQKLLNLTPIINEMNGLRDEIERETQEIQMQTVTQLTEYKDEVETIFYQISGFWGDNHAYIRAQDLDKLEESEAFYVPIFERNGQVFRVFQNYGFLRTDHYEIAKPNKSQIYPLETQDIEKEVVVKKRPSDMLTRIWDGQIQLLLNKCDEGLRKLEAQKEADEDWLKQHLFVHSTLGQHVTESLGRTMDEILNLKLEIQKTQHLYESIEAGEPRVG
ncbi:MAG: AAA family ATPase [Bacteroidota bacterium]